jgi:hypothetical protein
VEEEAVTDIKTKVIDRGTGMIIVSKGHGRGIDRTISLNHL